MRWYQRFFRRGLIEKHLDAELRFHLEQRVADLVARGMAPEEAGRHARLEFGGLDQVKEQCRDVGWSHLVETLIQDIRYGLRQFRRNPGFTAVAIITLALGIGANAALFSIVNSILLEPLPFAQPDRLMSITDSYAQGALVAMRSHLRSMEVAGYAAGQELNLTGEGEPVRLYGAAVSAKFFSLLGARPELGRTFLPGEDLPGQDNLVILSYELWQQKFAGDRSVIGRRITLEGQSREIVGVMPAEFSAPAKVGLRAPIQFSNAQFWVPLHLDPRAAGAYWGGGFMPVIGRLRPGVTLEQARAELRVYIPQMRAMFPWKMPDSLWASSTIVPLQDDLVGGARTKLFLLLGATGLVLLIACANVSNLLLARATVRQKEMALRAALGAGQRRILQQLLTESLILAAGGGALGTLLAVGGLGRLKSILPSDTPRLATVTMDWRVLAFTASVALLTSLIFGAVPALHASRVELTESLKTGQQHSALSGRRIQHALASAELALAVVLVAAAGLMVRSLWELLHVNPGFRTESILTARITPNESFCADFARCVSFYDQAVERVGALPGAEGAAVVNVLPLSGRINAFAADVEDHPRNPKDPAPVLFETIVTPNYFRLMGIPILLGREFTRADRAPNAPPVAIISEETARKFWPNENPIGKRFRRAWLNEWTTTVVGVAGDVNEYSLASKLPHFADGAVYVPYGSGAHAGVPRPAEMTLLLRTRDEPASAANALRQVVAGLNLDVPISEIQTIRKVVSESAEAPRSTTWLFALFATIALLLGAVGVYGVFSYSVAQRTPELGIRLALGAQSRQLMWLVMGQGTRLALAGIGIGLGVALALARFLSSLLYDVKPTDPATFIAVSLLLTAVALLACYIPARRAAKVDPMVALRHE